MKHNSKFAVLLIGRLVQAALAIMTMKLATKYLSTQEMGNYYLLSSIATFFGIILISPVGQFINRKIHLWHDKGVILKRFASYNVFVVAVALISIPTVFIIKRWFGFLTDISFIMGAGLAFTSIYLNTWAGTLVPAFNMLGKPATFTIFTLLNLAGSLMASMVLIHYFGELGTYWYLGQFILFQFLIVVCASFYLKKIINEDLNIEHIWAKISVPQVNQLIKFSGPLMFATFFMWLINDSYRFIVEKMVGLEFLGMMAVGLSVAASIFALLESLFQQIYYPVFYRKITNATFEERTKACQELIEISFPLFTFTAVFLACASPFLITTLTSSTYSSAFIFVIFGAGISLARVLTNVTASIAHSELSTKKLISPYLIGGLLTVVMLPAGLYLARDYFTVGLVLLLVNIIVLILMKFFMSKIIQIELPWKSLLSFVILALPFVLQVLFWKNSSFIKSILILIAFGVYYAGIVLLKFKKVIFVNKHSAI